MPRSIGAMVMVFGLAGTLGLGCRGCGCGCGNGDKSSGQNYLSPVKQREAYRQQQKERQKKAQSPRETKVAPRTPMEPGRRIDLHKTPILQQDLPTQDSRFEASREKVPERPSVQEGPIPDLPKKMKPKAQTKRQRIKGVRTKEKRNSL